MARPFKLNYAPLIAEYQTGLYSIKELAKKYKLKENTLRKQLLNNKAKINHNVNNGINLVDAGLELLQQEHKNAVNQKDLDTLYKGFEHIMNKHGNFGRFCVDLIQKGLFKANEILDSIDNARDFKSAMSGIKDGIDLLGIFPKIPPQINFIQTTPKEILKIEFIDDKNKNVEDVEIIENEKNTASKMDE